MDDWENTYQMVSSNVHQRNISERDIRTFKAHFLSVLAGVDPSFSKFMLDNLLAQTEITLNLILQVTLNLSMSTWEYFNGAFEYSETPFGPIGCKIIIHNTSKYRKYWDQRGREGSSL